jgi:hypothetical protein
VRQLVLPVGRVCCAVRGTCSGAMVQPTVRRTKQEFLRRTLTGTSPHSVAARGRMTAICLEFLSKNLTVTPKLDTIHAIHHIAYRSPTEVPFSCEMVSRMG